ncbi:MAG: aquaporin family protein [Phycisphaera sp.]|nr:aquaporin family protein [Phycisphaera sp.]
MEAALLGLFMVSACVATALFEYPASPVHAAIPSPMARRFCIGLAMGATAVGLIYSHWGKRSGAHMNPAFTLSFLRLGKIGPGPALLYILAQFIGGLLGVLISVFTLRRFVTDPSVNYAVTLPLHGGAGIPLAFAAEFVISFVLVAVVLTVNRSNRLAPWTGYFAALLLVVYITFEAPYSGMSLNPARSLASAIPAHVYRGLWVYFVAPTLGMLAAVELSRLLAKQPHTLCCKLIHCPVTPCVIQCNCLQHRSTTPCPPKTVTT